MSLLIRGSVGPEVQKLQEDLNTAGVSVDVDGIYGAATEQAVRTFQTGAALDVDGKAGPVTLAKLAELIAALPPPADPA
jgi:peptidoglycan hydrolase-like protein with peptidoglycan-binding domain